MSGNSHQRRVRRRAWEQSPEGRRYRFLVERDGHFDETYLSVEAKARMTGALLEAMVFGVGFVRFSRDCP